LLGTIIPLLSLSSQAILLTDKITFAKISDKKHKGERGMKPYWVGWGTVEDENGEKLRLLVKKLEEVGIPLGDFRMLILGTSVRLVREKVEIRAPGKKSLVRTARFLEIVLTESYRIPKRAKRKKLSKSNLLSTPILKTG
jgi:hypothetical protein